MKRVMMLFVGLVLFSMVQAMSKKFTSKSNFGRTLLDKSLNGFEKQKNLNEEQKILDIQQTIVKLRLISLCETYEEMAKKLVITKYSDSDAMIDFGYEVPLVDNGITIKEKLVVAAKKAAASCGSELLNKEADAMDKKVQEMVLALQARKNKKN